MRGVCALNLEAMTMFHNHDSPPADQPENGVISGVSHSAAHPHNIRSSSEERAEPPSVRSDIVTSQPSCCQSQAMPGSKAVHVTTSANVGSELTTSHTVPLVRQKLGHMTSNKRNSQKTGRFIPAVMVEKH